MELDDFIPLSYVSQYSYCPRRAGLLLLEQQWADSADTVKGSAEHKIVHDQDTRFHNGKVELTDMYVFSTQMHIAGKCDMVEAYPDNAGGIPFPFIDDKPYRLYPIEYKHGRLRNEKEYTYQLCAQAMCLEEMYGCNIESGAIFYISSHRKTEVLFTEQLRNDVKQICDKLHEMFVLEKAPRQAVGSKCKKCSMVDICNPGFYFPVTKYIDEITRGENGK